jgi:hypothetical protein
MTLLQLEPMSMASILWQQESGLACRVCGGALSLGRRCSLNCRDWTAVVRGLKLARRLGALKGQKNEPAI